VTVVVVGAGLAGLRVCEFLRREGSSDPIVLIGDEPHAPYSRPPLSKEVLRGGEPDVARLLPYNEIARLGVELRLASRARHVDIKDRRVHLEDAAAVHFDDLVIATGAHARPLPAVTAEQVFTLRTLEDSLSLREHLLPGCTVVIVGAGFIGLETAASARQLGCDVTVVDVLTRPLERAVDPSIGRAVQALHESHGVRFRLAVGVRHVTATPAGKRVVLTDGTVLDASVVVAGVGASPATAWLENYGLPVQDGVICSRSLGAGPRIWAIGDVARWSRSPGTTTRIEHWTNAVEMAQHAARNISHRMNEPFTTVPYVWSDQYDAKILLLGFTTKGDGVEMVHGSLEEPSWTALVRSGDRLGGVIGIRAARHVMRARSLLAARASWREALDAYA
jgi:NADPH-dependent 2,4-dienoyl-CoA reductase/sulfur reductase-like enzyme